jgi:MGT family glycosyltransferase
MSQSTMADEPRRFLVAMWEGGGNVPPQLGLARKLRSRGHDVRVLGDPCIRVDAEVAGCRFVPYSRAPRRADRSYASDILRDWEARTPFGAFGRLRDRIMFGPALAYAEDVLEELAREEADAAVVDFVLVGAAMGAEKAKVPTALAMHTIYQIPAPGMPGPGPGFLPRNDALGRVRDAIADRIFLEMFSRGLPQLNRARESLGLTPVNGVPELFGLPERVLVLTSRALDFEAAVLPANVRYVGPQVDDPAWANSWESPWAADHPDPLVVVSLSTTPQGQAGLLQRVIDAIEGLPVRALVTTGPAIDPGSLRHGSNVVVRAAAPHTQVFREAAVVVTHAGHGTVVRALVAGVPLLCLPMGRDQPDVAARVVHRGAGLRLPPSVRPGPIRASILRLLHDSRFREQAQQLSRIIGEEVHRDAAIAELEALASGTAVAA